MKKQIIPLLVLCSHCVAMHGYEGQGSDDSRNAPCTYQEAQERADRFDRFKEEHRLSDED